MKMPHPCPSSSRLVKTFFHNGKMTSFRGILGQSWNLKFHKVKLLKFQSFDFYLKFLWNWSFFHFEKIMRFKKVFRNLELEGQGRGIIMRVTHLLPLGPFYYIQANFMYFFPHVCNCTSNSKTFCSRLKSWIFRLSSVSIRMWEEFAYTLICQEFDSQCD